MELELVRDSRAHHRTGALAGFVHVLSGPDHLAAVTPMAVAGRERGWVSGWTWGFGHASGVVVVAVLAVILRDVLPPVEAISAWSERIVGGALIAVGLWALRRSTQMRTATHEHGVVSHRHLHIEAGPAWLRRLGHPHASFCLGVLHGVAGSSHFFGVLPALALPSMTASLRLHRGVRRRHCGGDDRHSPQPSVPRRSSCPMERFLSAP